MKPASCQISDVYTQTVPEGTVTVAVFSLGLNLWNAEVSVSCPAVMSNTLSHEEREALKQEIFHSLHCALPGNIISFDPDTQTASIQPAVKLGSTAYPILTDVPVFMPVSFEIHPGDACLVIFSDVDIDNWFETGEASAPNSPRRHSLSDGFAFVGFRVVGNPESGG